ncbi:hypothetical protein NDK43_08365 [Neobacillus pocheonensis]|jgi:hypothetical protein|uniref:Spore protein n=1 Tax=Neobacillus pocheonensis TaxID=363869 RepID=A0ABT0W8K2_9BACI|nr:hypothetical protein [Neobacillus pocheonensis]
MEKNNIHENGNPTNDIEQDPIMNRVNQSFDKMVEDVREMLNKNNEQLS